MIHPEELLSAYMDKEVSPEEKSLVESHLKSCPECQRHLKELESLRRTLSSLPLKQPSWELRAKVLSEPSPLWVISPWVKGLALAAAGVTVVLVAREQFPTFAPVEPVSGLRQEAPSPDFAPSSPSSDLKTMPGILMGENKIADYSGKERQSRAREARSSMEQLQIAAQGSKMAAKISGREEAAEAAYDSMQSRPAEEAWKEAEPPKGLVGALSAGRPSLMPKTLRPLGQQAVQKETLEWKGKAPGMKAGKKEIKNRKQFQELWKELKRKDPLPELDFSFYKVAAEIKSDSSYTVKAEPRD